MKDGKTVIAFDVNGTLQHKGVRELFNSLDRDKVEVIVWSSMGAEYAKRFCRDHGLTADEYLQKNSKRVDVAIDDQPSSVRSAELLLSV